MEQGRRTLGNIVIPYNRLKHSFPLAQSVRQLLSNTSFFMEETNNTSK